MEEGSASPPAAVAPFAQQAVVPPAAAAPSSEEAAALPPPKRSRQVSDSSCLRIDRCAVLSLSRGACLIHLPNPSPYNLRRREAPSCQPPPLASSARRAPSRRCVSQVLMTRVGGWDGLRPRQRLVLIQAEIRFYLPILPSFLHLHAHHKQVSPAAAAISSATATHAPGTATTAASSPTRAPSVGHFGCLDS